MQQRGESFDSRTHHNGSWPLPLFRPEAILHQQQKSYGEIIIIRPLSFTLLVWLIVFIVAGFLGIFIFGHYTETLHINGRLIVPQSSAGGQNLQAELAVPQRWLPLVQPGTHLSVLCHACAADTVQTGTVLRVADMPAESPQMTGAGPVYQVMVSLPPPQAAQALHPNRLPQAGMRVEAEIPLGRKPLIKWFFERSAS